MNRRASYEVSRTESVTIPMRAGHGLFLEILDQLTEDHYIVGTQLTHVTDMQGHGSDMHNAVGDVPTLLRTLPGNSHMRVVIAACQLQHVLKDRCIMSLDETCRFSVVDNKCVDCGRMKKNG